MLRFRSRFIAVAAAALGMSALLAAGPASAQKVAGETFHDEGSFTDSNFCGVPGLVVDGHFTVDGRFLGRLQGRNSVFYGMDNTRVVTVFTRRSTGQTATDIQPRTTSKDLRITINPNGTLTIVQLLTGGERTYGDGGKLIARNSGPVRFKIVVDYNRTLSNPDDDTELSRELIFGSTGTNDDFCAAVLADWGVAT
jgi:hypothetical protein